MGRGVVLVNAKAKGLEKFVIREQLVGLAALFDVFVDGEPEGTGCVRVHVPMHTGSEPLRQIGMDGFDRPLHKPLACGRLGMEVLQITQSSVKTPVPSLLDMTFAYPGPLSV